jgi:hypothetical protein
MSMPPEPPERLAEILMEILALSKGEGNSESECARGSDPVEPQCTKEQSQSGDQGDNNRQSRTNS